MASKGCSSRALAKGPGRERRPLVVYNAAVLRGEWSGVEKSVCQLARALSACSERPFDFTVLLPPDVPAVFPPDVNVVRLPRRACGRVGRVLYELLEMPSLVRRLRADSFLSPAYVTPPRLSCPSLLVLYDLHVYTHPRFCRWSNILHYRLRMRGSIRSASAVIVPTKHVLRALAIRFPKAACKTEVVPLGVSDCYFRRFSEDEKKRFLESHRLPCRYLVMVGASSPRKNPPGVIGGWARLRQEDSSLGLVLVGKGRKMGKLPEGAVNLGYLPEEEMPLLYACAEALVYPSFDEGFGLPVAEAMAVGCPVVTSPIPMREFADGAAVFCDPHFPESISKALREVVPGPWGRAEGRLHHVQVGRERAETLSWTRTASRVVMLIADVLKDATRKAPSR